MGLLAKLLAVLFEPIVVTVSLSEGTWNTFSRLVDLGAEATVLKKLPPPFLCFAFSAMFCSKIDTRLESEDRRGMVKEENNLNFRASRVVNNATCTRFRLQ
jgi:hypothetical protein